MKDAMLYKLLSLMEKIIDHFWIRCGIKKFFDGQFGEPLPAINI